MYLLDTNACIALINATSTSVANRFKANPPSDYYISSIVRSELVYGARNSSRIDQNLRVVELFVKPLNSLAFDAACADAAGLIRSNLKRLGTPIGPLDTLIAASAVAHDLTLITHNVKEFDRVFGLKYEDWQA